MVKTMPGAEYRKSGYSAFYICSMRHTERVSWYFIMSRPPKTLHEQQNGTHISDAQAAASAEKREYSVAREVGMVLVRNGAYHGIALTQKQNSEPKWSRETVADTKWIVERNDSMESHGEV